MSTDLTPTAQRAALETDAQAWAARARELQITDRDTCREAGILLRSIKTLRNQVQAWWAPHIEAAMETKRKAEAGRKALADGCAAMEAPLVEAETVLKRALLSYEAAEERRRREDEQRLQAEAQARAEALVLEAAASMEREAAETGDPVLRQEAADLLAQPVEAPVAVVPKAVPRVDGISYSDRWEAHPDVDVQALAAAVGSGAVPITFVTPNWTALSQYARATKGTGAVPGVRFWNNRRIAARG